MSARILGGLPLILVLTYLSAPDYIMALFTSAAGLGIFAIACGLYLAGILWLKTMLASEHRLMSISVLPLR